MAVRNHLVSLSILLVLGTGLLLRRATTHPSAHRDWIPSQAELATVHVYGNDVRIDNLRNTDRRAGNGPVSTVSRSFQLSDLQRAWLVLERQGAGRAHVMISFEFEGSDFIVVSPEPRLEKGETFWGWLGLFRRYELVYVIATERDAIGARASKNPVYLFQLRLDVEELRHLFTEMTERADHLLKAPEFYHTLFNNGVGNVMRHLRPLAPRPSRGPVMVPSQVDARLYDMKLLQADGSIEFLRGRGLISPLAETCAEAGDYSACIRRNIPLVNDVL